MTRPMRSARTSSSTVDDCKQKLPWRRARATNFSRVLLISPSAEFVASLPGGTIPQRQDFYAHSHDERERRWQSVVDASERLGDELRELVESGRIAEHVKPW